MSVRIAGWAIDGFGVFTDYTSPPLDDGLTVFLGANEAGKSTLLAFIRGVLFGFRDGRSAGSLYPPVSGGRHGGRLLLAADDGLYTVDRAAGRRARPVMTLPGGGSGGPPELRRLLGNADETLFESVFAFSLAELQELSTLTKEDIADRIFGASLMGAGRSPQQVLADLEAQAAPLFKQRGHNTTIANLLREHDELSGRLRLARVEAAGLVELDRELVQADAGVEIRRSAAEELRRRHTDVATLIRLWPEALELRQARLDLDSLSPAGRLEPSEAATLADLTAEAQLQRDRLATLSRLDAEIEHLQAAQEASLDHLGADWSSDRLDTIDTALPARDEVREWTSRLKAAAADAAVAAAASDQVARDQAAWTVQHDRARAGLPAEPPLVADLAGRLHSLGELRGLLADLRRDGSAARPQPGLLKGVLLFVAATILGLGAWFVVRGDAVPAIVLFVAAVAVAGITIGAGRGSTPAIDQSMLQEHAASLVQSLGLPAHPSSVDLSLLENDLRRLEDDRRAYDAAMAQLAHLVADGADLERRTAAAGAQIAEYVHQQATLESAWSQWRAARGVPEGLTPDGVVEFFVSVGEARRARSALAAAQRERERLSAALAAWERRAQSLLGVDLAGEVLVTRLFGLTEAHAQREKLEATVARCTRAVETSGTEDALRELATADIDELRRQAGTLLGELHLAEDLRDQAVEARQVLRSRLEAVQQSADVPAVDALREQVLARLNDELDKWRTLRLAASLMEQTVGRFVAEHQPAVLSRASRLFAKATGGRYPQVLQEGLSREFAVVDSESRRRRPAELSRGTAEQLYLCIRLSFAAEFGARAVALPLVMDDVLVNFDPARARATAELLAETAMQRQLLYFTCHPATRDLLVEAAGEKVTVIDLDERRPAGSPA